MVPVLVLAQQGQAYFVFVSWFKDTPFLLECENADQKTIITMCRAVGLEVPDTVEISEIGGCRILLLEPEVMEISTDQHHGFWSCAALHAIHMHGCAPDPVIIAYAQWFAQRELEQIA